MGTRSRIGIQENGVIKSVYCHWDGYLSNNGKILLEHYDQEKTNQLISLGDLSSLGPEIGVEHEFDAPGRFNSPEFLEYNAKYGKMCKFYGRDRKELDTNMQVAYSVSEFVKQADDCGADYYYLLRDGVWYCGSTYTGNDMHNRLVELREALEIDESLRGE